MTNRITPFLPASANADPATSHEAEERVTKGGSREAHCNKILRLVRKLPGCTSVELYHGLDAHEQEEIDRHEISRRLADLRNAGLVRQGEPRSCNIKGTKMVTWYAVAKQGTLF